MEASLTVARQGAVARRQVEDPLSEILVGQLSEHTRRAYRHDVSHLLLFLQEGPVPEWGQLSREAKHVRLARALGMPEALRLLLTVTRADLIAFRTHLKEVGLCTLMACVMPSPLSRSKPAPPCDACSIGWGIWTRGRPSATTERGRISPTTRPTTWRGCWGSEHRGTGGQPGRGCRLRLGSRRRVLISPRARAP